MKKYIMKPAEQRVLVLPEEEGDRIGLIFIPSTVQKDVPKLGTVIAVGEGNIDIPMKYYPGQLVMFSQYAGSDLKVDLGDGEKTYSIMNQIDIWGTLTPLES
jgi:co-chaperonin GroES (HSP10)